MAIASHRRRHYKSRNALSCASALSASFFCARISTCTSRPSACAPPFQSRTDHRLILQRNNTRTVFETYSYILLCEHVIGLVNTFWAHGAHDENLVYMYYISHIMLCDILQAMFIPWTKNWASPKFKITILVVNVRLFTEDQFCE